MTWELESKKYESELEKLGYKVVYCNQGNRIYATKNIGGHDAYIEFSYDEAINGCWVNCGTELLIKGRETTMTGDEAYEIVEQDARNVSGI